MLRSRVILAGAAVPLALALGDCGTTDRPAPPLSAEQRAVASANAICAEYLAFARDWTARWGQRAGARAIARLLVVKRAAAKRRQQVLVAVAGRPRVQAYLSRLAERERALLEVRRLAGGSLRPPATVPKAAVDRLYASARETYASARALGLSGCVGVPSRRPGG